MPGYAWALDHTDWLELGKLTISLGVSVIPEGLVAVTTGLLLFWLLLTALSDDGDWSAAHGASACDCAPACGCGDARLSLDDLLGQGLRILALWDSFVRLAH